MPETRPSLLPFRRRAPFAGPLLAAMSGILASDQRPEWWPAWVAAFLCVVPVLLKSPSTWLGCLLTFLIFGFWHGNQVATDTGYQRSRQQPYDAEEHTVTLLVLNEPKMDQLRSLQRFFARVSCIDNQPVDFRVSAECSGEPFSYGDRMIAQGKFSTPTHPLNPGEFDFGTYLQRQSIYVTFRARRNVPAMVIAKDQGSPVVALALSVRHHILQTLQEGLEDDVEVAQTMQGMILGARGETSPKLKALFRDTGTIHLFAASGLQVALFTGLAWRCLCHLRLPRRSTALAIVPVAFAYCALTGFYPATVRATVMAILMAAGASLERPVATVNSLCASGVLILIHDTQELFQTGFQLSFVAVFAILTTVRPFGHLLYRPFQVDPFFPSRLLSPWQRIWHQGLLHACEIFSLSTISWGATAPILIFQEHRISLISAFTNLLVVPPATMVMFLGAIGLLAGSLSASLTIYFNNTAWLMTKLILAILHAAILAPCHSINVSLTSLLQPDRATALCEGSEQVIHLRVDGHDWLINTGKPSQWRTVTEPYLQGQGVNRLDGLILCDAPAHSAETLEEVEKNFQVEKVIQFTPAGKKQEAPSPGNRRVLTTDPGTESGPIQVLSSEQLSRGDALTKEAAIQGILVRLRQFRILILPSVNEASLAGLKCDHADVVYCGRLRGRRFPRDLLISKLKPAVLIVNGTKAEITATSQHDASGPKYFYLKQDGAVTTALLNEGLIVQGYRGSEFRLRNRSR